MIRVLTETQDATGQAQERQFIVGIDNTLATELEQRHRSAKKGLQHILQRSTDQAIRTSVTRRAFMGGVVAALLCGIAAGMVFSSRTAWAVSREDFPDLRTYPQVIGYAQTEYTEDGVRRHTVYELLSLWRLTDEVGLDGSAAQRIAARRWLFRILMQRSESELTSFFEEHLRDDDENVREMAQAAYQRHMTKGR